MCSPVREGELTTLSAAMSAKHDVLLTCTVLTGITGGLIAALCSRSQGCFCFDSDISVT